MRKTLLTALTATTLLIAAPVFASTDVEHPKEMEWEFDGIFGTVDRQAAQRGYQVYKEVCAACHSMKYKSFRNLKDIGFSEGEVKTIAASYNVQDGPNDSGEMFERPGRASDRFPSPFANEKAARAANGGAFPPDLSLIIKARHDGANYVHALLTGYTTPPAGVPVVEGKAYNPYFPGHWIGMPQPITTDGQVTYSDGTTATVEQMSKDLVVFLQWAAEPEMEARKRMGLKVILFLAVFTGLFFVAKKRVWSRLD